MPIDFICPTCGKSIPRELNVIIPHTEQHIIDAIKKKYPKWAEDNGVCGKCLEHYRKQMRHR
ncbi:MAG: hypothetical protein ABIJ27_04070 [Candidatus Omnitrophota bacterium]